MDFIVANLKEMAIASLTLATVELNYMTAVWIGEFYEDQLYQAFGLLILAIFNGPALDRWFVNIHNILLMRAMFEPEYATKTFDTAPSAVKSIQSWKDSSGGGGSDQKGSDQKGSDQKGSDSKA